MVGPARLEDDRNLGAGISPVGLATTWIMRSPQASMRMVPAAVFKVTPFESL